MPRFSQFSDKERRLGHLCRSIPKVSSVDQPHSHHGRFRRWTLPPVFYGEEPPTPLRSDCVKQLRRKKSTSSETSHFDQRSVGSHSNVEDSSDEELSFAKQSTTTDCPGSSLDRSPLSADSSSSGRIRRRPSSGEDWDEDFYPKIPTFLRLSDSRKLARNRRMRHPHKWIRTCHMAPLSSPKSSRVRLIVSEEISSSYTHLFSFDDVWEPYDPESYQDSHYLKIPSPHRGWWKCPSLDRISELSQTSMSINLSDNCASCCKLSDHSSSQPTNSPPCTICRNASPSQSYIERPATTNRTDGVQLSPVPACSRLFNLNSPESGDQEIVGKGGSERLRSAVKVIQSRSSAVAKFMGVLERKKTEIVPPMLYRNLEAIQRKLEETHEVISGMCSGLKNEETGFGKNTKAGKISISADSVIRFLQSTIAKSVETLKHLENLDAVVCRKILSEVSSVLSDLRREGVASETEVEQTVRETLTELSHTDNDLSLEHGESDSSSEKELCSPRVLPRRQTHKRFQPSRRRRCPPVHNVDKSMKSVTAYPSETQKCGTGWLSCHKTFACCHPQTLLSGNKFLTCHESETIPVRSKSIQPKTMISKPIPRTLSRKRSFHVPPKRIQYTPQLPYCKPHYHMCSSCDRPHRLLTPHQHHFRDTFGPESDVKILHSHPFHNDSRTAKLGSIFTENRNFDMDLGRRTVSYPKYQEESPHRHCQPSLLCGLPEKSPVDTQQCPPKHRHRSKTAWVPQYPTNNASQRLPTYLARRRLGFVESQQAIPRETPLPEVLTNVYTPGDRPPPIRPRLHGRDFTHSPGCCYHRLTSMAKCRYPSSPDESLSRVSASSTLRSRSCRTKIRKGRSNILAVRSDDEVDDSESSDDAGETTTWSKESSVQKGYTVVLKCARINVYVDNEKEEQEQSHSSIVEQVKNVSTQIQSGESMQKALSTIQEKKNPESEDQLLEIPIDQEDVGKLPSAKDSHGLFNSFTRMKVVFPAHTEDGLAKNFHGTRRHFKHVDSRQRGEFAMSNDMSEKQRRLAKPADVSRTESSSESSVMSDTKETLSSSSPESDWSSPSTSSYEDLHQLGGKMKGDPPNKDNTPYCQGVRRRCRTSVTASGTDAPRPLRRWLVLGSEWTPPSEETPVQAVFDTPSQTAPLFCVKGNDFCCGTKRDTTYTKQSSDTPSSNVAFPEDVTCSYTASGHRIESCVASYTFARPGFQGLPVPLEASVVPPDDEDIAKLSFQRMGAIPQDGKSTPKPLVVFPQAVDSVLSPSGHHLESCCARFVFLNEEAISAKSSPSGSNEQLETRGPSRTFVILPFFRATPLQPGVDNLD